MHRIRTLAKFFLFWTSAVLVPSLAFPISLKSRPLIRGSTAPLFAAGPKSEGARRQRRRSENRASSQDRSRPSRRAPAIAVPFDGKVLTQAQNSNQDTAETLDLKAKLQDGSVRCVSDDYTQLQWGESVDQSPFAFYSLKKLFGTDFSETFHSDTDFRNELRSAIRQDVFDTTPAYANLSEKAAAVLLLPDSSLQGSWRKQSSDEEIRMKHTTKLLRRVFGKDFAVSGDDLMHTIGSLCGSNPSTHWIDIVGVQDRIISHSFHQDTGVLSPPNGAEAETKTVLWGFPPADNYRGTGVFSHIAILKDVCVAPQDHPHMQPVLFDGAIPPECIIRPEFSIDNELLVYRDVDVVHSSPDVAYRTSLMRFM